jgi:hypothetical protein
MRGDRFLKPTNIQQLIHLDDTSSNLLDRGALRRLYQRARPLFRIAPPIIEQGSRPLAHIAIRHVSPRNEDLGGKYGPQLTALTC